MESPAGINAPQYFPVQSWQHGIAVSGSPSERTPAKSRVFKSSDDILADILALFVNANAASMTASKINNALFIMVLFNRLVFSLSNDSKNFLLNFLQYAICSLSPPFSCFLNIPLHGYLKWRMLTVAIYHQILSEYSRSDGMIFHTYLPAAVLTNGTFVIFRPYTATIHFDPIYAKGGLPLV